MSRNLFIPFQLLGKSWIAALLLLQLGCSASNDPSLEYQSGSTLNPSGPTAPNNDPLTPPDPRNPVNWFSNGDLESGTGPWYPQGDNVTATRTSAQRHGGIYSLLVAGRSDTWHGAVMPLIKTLPTGEYEASVWVRLAAGEEPAEIRLSLKAQPEGGDPTYTTIRSAEVTADGWTRLSGTFQNNNPGRWGDLTLYVESPEATVSYYVDDLTVAALSNLIINGGIESGILPWRVQGGSVLITQASEQRHSGDYSLLVTGRTANWNGPVMDLPPLSAGRSYQASIWVRLAPGTPATQLNLTRKRTLVGGAEDYNQLGSAQVTDAAWVELAGGFTHVADGPLQEHFLYIESSEAGAAASFYVDDLELAIPTQLVVNGDVESSLSGWGPFGQAVNLERTSAAANTGTYSVLVSNRNAEWQGASFTVAAPQAGDLYQFSCHVRMAPENSDATVIMTIKLSDAVYIEVGRTDATSASWVQLSGSYLHDPDGTETEFTPYIQASVATAEYLIDTCSVIRQ
jgi:Carbohydrate binding domain.